MPDRVADGIGYAGDLYNPFKVKVTCSTAPNLTSGVEATVPFDTVAFDTGTMFGTVAGAGANQIKIPVAGYYISSAGLNLTVGGAAAQNPVVTLKANVGGTPMNYGRYDWSVVANVPTTSFWTIPAHDVAFFNAGDLLDLRLTVSWAGAAVVSVGGTFTWWAMHRLSS